MFSYVGEKNDGDVHVGLIVGCVLGGVLLLIMIVFLYLCCRRRFSLEYHYASISDSYFCLLIQA